MSKTKEKYMEEVQMHYSEEQMLDQMVQDQHNDMMYELFSCLNPKLGDKVTFKIGKEEEKK